MQPGSGRGTGTDQGLLRLSGNVTPADAYEAAVHAVTIGLFRRNGLLDGFERPTDIRLDPPLQARVS
jgi:hypothetical protein